MIRSANPELEVDVVAQGGDVLVTWDRDVLSGSGPDLLLASNDNLFAQSQLGTVADMTADLHDKLDGFLPVSVDSAKVGDRIYMIPKALKVVGLWYDRSTVQTPPATTPALLQDVKNGSIRLAMNQTAYHLFGFTGAFGGTLLDPTGTCVADRAGVAEALRYLADLRAAGAVSYTDAEAARKAFASGNADAIIDGSWQATDFKAALGDRLAVASLPDGPSGAKANPLVGADGWLINPNSVDKVLATRFALAAASAASEQVFMDEAGDVPAVSDVAMGDPIVAVLAEVAATGLPRPQSREFGGYFAPFGKAIDDVIDDKADPVAAVKTACKAMNLANGR